MLVLSSNKWNLGHSKTSLKYCLLFGGFMVCGTFLVCSTKKKSAGRFFLLEFWIIKLVVRMCDNKIIQKDMLEKSLSYTPITSHNNRTNNIIITFNEHLCPVVIESLNHPPPLTRRLSYTMTYILLSLNIVLFRYVYLPTKTYC